MRKHINQTNTPDGAVFTEVDWSRDDYIEAIEMLENSITQRMRDEAILGNGFMLAEKRAEIDVLRDEMNNLTAKG